MGLVILCQAIHDDEEESIEEHPDDQGQADFGQVTKN